MRASFGGAADLSQQLSIFYDQYSDRLADLAERAANRAEDEEAATDQDKINAWQSGDISDDDLIAYLQQRIADGTNDPKVTTQLKDALRNVQDTVAQRTISDTAQSIIDGIENGTRTWTDLKNYYATQRKKYRPSDPIYKSLTDQITQVSDRIRDNEISGGIEKATYLFQSKQITGKQAAAQIRALASRYKNEDPTKYYQLLQQATQLDQYGGFYKGSGGGGGSASSTKKINQLIDTYQAQRNILKSLGDQFDSGATVGTAADGSRYLLRNPDGTPSDSLRQAEHQLLGVYDQLAAAQSSKGDNSAATATLAEKQDYILTKIQPRNTIGPEQQRGAMLDTIAQTVQQADESNDPEKAISDINLALNRYRSWVEKLNTTRNVAAINKVEREDVVGSPERRDANASEDSTTSDFVSESANIYNAMTQALAGNPNVDLPEGLASLNSSILGPMAAVSQVAAGLANGTMTWYLDPEKGPTPIPVTTRVDINGNVVPNVPNNAVPTIAIVGGNPVQAYAPTQPVHVWTGGDLVDASGKVIFRDGQAVTDDQLKAVQAQAGTTLFPGISTKQDVTRRVADYTQLVAPDSDGNLQVWYGSSDGGWSKGSPQAVKVAAPIIAKTGLEAQQIANKLGLDPTGQAYGQSTHRQQRGGFTENNDLTGDTVRNFVPRPEPTGRSVGGSFSNNNPFRANFSSPFSSSASASKATRPGGFTEREDVPGSLMNMAQQFGISVRLPSQKNATSGRGFFANEPFSGPSVRAPSLSSFKLNIPTIKDFNVTPFATSTFDEARQIKRTIGQHVALDAGGGLIR